jgi:hypothetical protein
VNLKRFLSPSMAVAGVSLFVALGGGSYAAAQGQWMQHNHPDARKDIQLIHHLAPHLTVGNAKRLGGRPASAFVSADRVASSGGVKFLSAGQTMKLGKVGHFTFSATCSTVGGQHQVSFDVVADTTAALDGNTPMAAGSSVNIHTNSDALDGKNPGDFDQVGSASSSTELAADGQEVDVFYEDGVNWPALGGAPAHDCFAGYTGFMG